MTEDAKREPGLPNVRRGAKDLRKIPWWFAGPPPVLTRSRSRDGVTGMGGGRLPAGEAAPCRVCSLGSVGVVRQKCCAAHLWRHRSISLYFSRHELLLLSNMC